MRPKQQYRRFSPELVRPTNSPPLGLPRREPKRDCGSSARHLAPRASPGHVTPWSSKEFSGPQPPTRMRRPVGDTRASGSRSGVARLTEPMKTPRLGPPRTPSIPPARGFSASLDTATTDLLPHVDTVAGSLFSTGPRPAEVVDSTRSSLNAGRAPASRQTLRPWRCILETVGATASVLGPSAKTSKPANLRCLPNSSLAKVPFHQDSCGQIVSK